MTLTVGALFAGMGGLELGVQSVLGGELAWYAEWEKAPAAIMAHHHPDVPNLGDVTKVDWHTVPPVDVITGGSPCQDLSHAGKRKGMTDGTRSNLWSEMREAVAVIRPRLVVWENVVGALSASAVSDVEREPGLLGDRPGGSALRAIGRVVGDLASLGYVGRYYGLRAADVGAAHGRFRIFLFATPGDTAGDDLRNDSLTRSGGAGGARLTSRGADRATADPVGVGGYETVEHDGGRPAEGDRGSVPDERDRDAVWARPERADGLTLLPTPAVNDMGAGKSVDAWDAWTERMQAAHGNGNGHGKSLEIEALRLLPTPRTSDTNGAGAHGDGGLDLRTSVSLLPTPVTAYSATTAEEWRARRPAGNGATRDLVGDLRIVVEEVLPTQDWGIYDAAIRRQEAAFGHPAPSPTEPAKGQRRLSPRFVEWLMALPPGWVTDVPGVSRNDQLKALGNGVSPPQCAAATRAFLSDIGAGGAA